MKKLILILSILSFSSFAGSYEVIGGSCWKCVGGSFKSGEIECTPERTARLFERPMSECTGSNNRRSAVMNPSQIKKQQNAARIRRLQQEISRLERANQNL